MDRTISIKPPTVAKPHTVGAKGRFILNLSSNLTSFGVSILVGLWMTPYLIRHLGVAAFGLIPLATTVTSYMSLFTSALNSAVGRFITIALDRKDDIEANRYFNTSFWGTLAVLLVLLIPAVWLSTQARFFFNVPAGYEQQFTWLFLCTIGMFFLTTLGSAFGVATFCRNRFDLSNAVSIVCTLVRVLAILLLFYFWSPKVWHVGAAMLAATAISVWLTVLVWRHLTPTLRVQRAAFSRKALAQLTGMGGWMVVNQIGSLLYLSIDLVVVNKMFGAEDGGRYGAVLLWSAMLRSLGGVLAGVFGPTIISLYGKQDIAGLVAYSRRVVKFVGLLLALPIGLVCGLAYPLLAVWVGPALAPLAPLMILLTFPLCVNLAVLPLFNIQVAANRVRLPGILTCVMGAGNLGLALLLAGPVGWGLYGVAAAGAIMLTAKNLIFTPIYGSRILGLKLGAFYREMLPIIGATSGLALSGWVLALVWPINSWLSLGVAGILLTAVFVLFVYRFLLTINERQQMAHLGGPRLASLIR